MRCVGDASKAAQDCLFGGNIIKTKMSPILGFKRHFTHICYNLNIPSGLRQIIVKINTKTFVKLALKTSNYLSLIRVPLSLVKSK
jgi:hypothetical protein